MEVEVEGTFFWMFDGWMVGGLRVVFEGGVGIGVLIWIYGYKCALSLFSFSFSPPLFPSRRSSSIYIKPTLYYLTYLTLSRQQKNAPLPTPQGKVR